MRQGRSFVARMGIAFAVVCLLIGNQAGTQSLLAASTGTVAADSPSTAKNKKPGTRGHSSGAANKIANKTAGSSSTRGTAVSSSPNGTTKTSGSGLRPGASRKTPGPRRT